MGDAQQPRAVRRAARDQVADDVVAFDAVAALHVAHHGGGESQAGLGQHPAHALDKAGARSVPGRGGNRRIRPVRVALQNQRDALLAFAGVLDGKLADIAQTHAIAELLVREACLLHRLPSTSPAYGQGWNRLRAQTGGKFHALFAAVSRAMADTPRSSSLVENLNSRLRSYLTLCRHLGASYLDLLRFFLNHRRILCSRHAERQGKSPQELMTR